MTDGVELTWAATIDVLLYRVTIKSANGSYCEMHTEQTSVTFRDAKDATFRVQALLRSGGRTSCRFKSGPAVAARDAVAIAELKSFNLERLPISPFNFITHAPIKQTDQGLA